MSPRARLSLGLLTLAVAACATAGVDGSYEDVALPERRSMSGPEPDGGSASPSPEASVPNGTTENDDAGAMQQSGDAGPNGPPPGRWFQANGQDCVTDCAGRGATNVPSPEGAKCTFGENIPQSALTAGITYDECFPSCNAHLAGANASSVGKYCYAAGQKQDDDSSDVTRGCFCR
jgi:hypothetical protein